MKITVLLSVALFSSAAAADDKAKLLADENAAFERAKPVFEKYCSGCHTHDGKQATAKKLDHFEMTKYPFGGRHAGTLGPRPRRRRLTSLTSQARSPGSRLRVPRGPR